MYSKEICKKTVYGVKNSYNEKDFDVSNCSTSDDPLKIDIYEVGTLTELSSTISLDSSLYSVQLSGYPENALTIELKKGEYVIAYDEGGLISKTTGKINDCIYSSAAASSQKFEFDDLSIDDPETLSSLSNDSTSESYFMNALNDIGYECHKTNIVKINSKTKLHIWINDENIVGILRLKIFKINSGRHQEKLVSSLVKVNTDGFTIELPYSMTYKVVVSEIKEDKMIVPQYKYPMGTYQIVKYDKIGNGYTQTELDRLIAIDSTNFNRSNGKLQSLDNIEIPHDVDPLNQYVMLGKVELMLYIDFNNDEFYLRPSSYAEVFMNLFVPKMEITPIEETDDYAIYSIIDYIIVEYDFRNKNKIISSIKNWLKCDDANIHVDEYDIYYYITNFTLYEWYYSRFRSIIEDHFMFINLSSIKAVAFDNVEILRDQHDSALDFEITNCNWKVVVNPNISRYNVIEWDYNDNWTTTDIPNEVKIEVPGEGIIKVSKKHFKNITGVDIDVVKEGTLSDSQFKSLRLNYPIINPYSRLQYWLGIKL